MSPTPMMESLWAVGTRHAQPVVDGLGTTVDELPQLTLDAAWSEAPALEGWRQQQLVRPPVAGAVVAVWPDLPVACSVVDLDLADWTSRFETGFAQWFVALSTACARCQDGGQVVAVTERPEPKASGGWAIESALADAVEVLAKSLVEVERPRGIRVNVVSTSARLGAAQPMSWSGLVGVVRMLLGAEGSGVNNTVIRMDP